MHSLWNQTDAISKANSAIYQLDDVSFLIWISLSTKWDSEEQMPASYIVMKVKCDKKRYGSSQGINFGLIERSFCYLEGSGDSHLAGAGEGVW